MQTGFILSLIVAIIIAIFALKNGDSVLIDFLFAKVEVSQAIVILVSATLGAVIVTILGIVRQIKLTIKIKDQGKKVKALEETNKNLEDRISELIAINKKEPQNSVENTDDNKEIKEEDLQNGEDSI